MSFDVFLSHNSADKADVELLAKRLRDGAGMSVWLDKWEMTVGDTWQHEIEAGLSKSKACAIFVGPNGLGDWQLDEIRAAQVLHKERPEFQIVPVLLPGSNSKSLPLFLRSNFNWVDFREGVESAAAFVDLAAGIRGSGSGTPVAVGPASGDDIRLTEVEADAAPARCPYKGLDAFQESDAEYFFGRGVFVEQILLEHLRHSRSVAVVGMSGSGKSSAVRAGLLPRLREGAFKGSAPNQIITLKPGARPLEELAVQLVQALYTGVDRALKLPQFIEALQKSEETLHLILRAESKNGPFLLLIDQFEESFTICTDEAQRQRFFDNICYAASLSDSPVHIVITMRSDFVSKCASYPDLNMLISENFLQMPNMGVQDLRTAIEEPARKAGLEFEHGLPEIILNDVEHSSASLPLLQHALFRLWQQRTNNTLTFAGYEAIGRVQGSLVQHAEEIYSHLPKGTSTLSRDSESLGIDHQDLCRKIFLRLVTLGEGAGDTRRRASRAELLSLGSGVDPVLSTLIDKRLLVSESDALTGAETVEIIHEALIRAWPRFADWVNTDRDFLRFRQRLSGDVEEWERRSRTQDDVYRGAHLLEAEEFLKAMGDDLTPSERDFIAEGIGRRQREIDKEIKAKKRLRNALIAACIGLVIAAGSAIFARHLYMVSHSKELAAQVIAGKAEDPVKLLKLAVEAYDIDPSFEAGQALRFALRQASARTVIEHSGALSIDCSPTEEKVAIASADNTVHVWSLKEPKLLFVLKGHTGKIDAARFFKKGTRILTISEDNTSRVWDAGTGRLLKVNTYQDPLSPYSYDITDAGILATIGKKSTINVLDAETGRSVYLKKDSELAVIPRLSPDGGHLSIFTIRGIVLVDLVSRKEEVVAQYVTGGSRFQVFTPDSKVLYVDQNPMGSPKAKQQTMVVIDVKTGSKVGTIFSEPLASSIVFDTSGTRALIPHFLGRTDLIRYNSSNPLELGSIEHVLEMQIDAALTSRFSNTGKYVLATGGTKAQAYIWKTDLGVQGINLDGHRGGVTSAAFSANDSMITSLGADQSVAIWQGGADWYARHEFELSGMAYSGGHAGWINDSTFASHAQDSVMNMLNVFTHSSTSIKLPYEFWRTAPVGGAAPYTYTDTSFIPLRYPSFAPEQIVHLKPRHGIRLIYSDSLNAMFQDFAWGDSGVGYRDGKTGTMISHVGDAAGVQTGVLPSLNFKTVLLSYPNFLMRLWDVASGTEIAKWPINLGEAHFSNDGHLLLLMDSVASILIYDIEHRREILHLHGDFGMDAWLGGRILAGLSPDNKTFFVMTRKGNAEIYEIATGKKLFQIRPPADRLLNGFYSPDGKWIGTGCLNGSMQLWNAATGELEADLPSIGGYGMVLFAPNSKLFVHLAYGDMMPIGYTNISDVYALAKRRITELTSGDLQRY